MAWSSICRRAATTDSGRRLTSPDPNTDRDPARHQRRIRDDAACAAGYATARTAREQAGRPVSIQDALIGGVALALGATLATRNLADFDGYGLSLVDPWHAE